MSPINEEVQKPQILSEKREVDWLIVVLNLQLYFSFFCGLHLAVYDAFWKTIFFSLFLIALGIIGITAGSHRLWAHQSYVATTQLKIFLMLCQTLVGIGPIYNWVRLHRLHHKHFGTNLDPFNPNQGFFYSHFISNTLKLSPAQEKSLEEIDMSDLESDKIVMFQKRYYWILYAIITLLLPINAPAEYWGETILSSAFVVGWFRYAILVNVAFLVNSATKIWSLNPGEKYPHDSNLIFIINKNYWLSFHYLAPWDYQTGEFGKYGIDYTTQFIRVCAALEYATDLKTVDSHTVRQALIMSVDEKKPITECLLKLQNNDNVPEDYYLTPNKFY